MRTRKLMAIKPHKYGTRHLTAGEEYEASHGHAIALVAVKKARYAAARPSEPQAAPVRSAPGLGVEKPEPALAADAKTIDELRLQATQLGIGIDGRWGVVRLQHEIAKASD